MTPLYEIRAGAVVNSFDFGVERMAEIEKLQPAAGYEEIPTPREQCRPVVYARREHTTVDEIELLGEGPGAFDVVFLNDEFWTGWIINTGWRQIHGQNLSLRKLLGYGNGPSRGPTSQVEDTSG